MFWASLFAFFSALNLHISGECLPFLFSCLFLHFAANLGSSQSRLSSSSSSNILIIISSNPPFQSPPIPAIPPPHHHPQPLLHPYPLDHSHIKSSVSPNGPKGQDLHHLPQDQIHHLCHHNLGWELEIELELYVWSVRMEQGRVWADFGAQICCNWAALSWVFILQAW